MAIHRDSLRRSTIRTYSIGGLSAVLLGFVVYLVGRAFDGGFVGGMFDGATFALMVMGAYLLGATRWWGRKSERDLHEGKAWLPSRDSTDGQGAR